MIDLIRRRPLLSGFVALLLLMLIASTLMYWAEGAAQPEKFGSIPRTMWWTIVTLTTVGYGDVYPVTPVGKFLAKKGPGIHHVAYQVDDIEAWIGRRLREHHIGVRRRGTHLGARRLHDRDALQCKVFLRVAANLVVAVGRHHEF